MYAKCCHYKYLHFSYGIPYSLQEAASTTGRGRGKSADSRQRDFARRVRPQEEQESSRMGETTAHGQTSVELGDRTSVAVSCLRKSLDWGTAMRAPLGGQPVALRFGPRVPDFGARCLEKARLSAVFFLGALVQPARRSSRPMAFLCVACWSAVPDASLYAGPSADYSGRRRAVLNDELPVLWVAGIWRWIPSHAPCSGRSSLKFERDWHSSVLFACSSLW